MSGKNVIQYLLSKDSEISKGGVEAIVRLFDIELTQKLAHQKHYLNITRTVVTAAASRRNNLTENLHTEIMTMLLRRDSIQITKHAVAAIAEQFDATVVGLLLRRRNTVLIGSVMKTLWQRFHSQIESHLINKPTCIRIMEMAVVVALAKTRCNDKDLVKFLLLRSDMKITGEVLIAAAGNRWCGKEMMEVLTHNNDVQITEAVIQVALCNRPGKHVVELLFKRDGVEITAALMEKAVQHWCIRVETLELFLYNLPVEYVLKAALATKKFPELLPIAIHEGQSIG